MRIKNRISSIQSYIVKYEHICIMYMNFFGHSIKHLKANIVLSINYTCFLKRKYNDILSPSYASLCI